MLLPFINSFTLLFQINKQLFIIIEFVDKWIAYFWHQIRNVLCRNALKRYFNLFYIMRDTKKPGYVYVTWFRYLV